MALLSRRGFASDPVEAWKETFSSSSEAEKTARGLNFDYLLGLSMTEETAELLSKRREKVRTAIRYCISVSGNIWLVR